MARRVRTLADLGETALIERIAKRAGAPSSQDWRLGIGDDAAILQPRSGSDLVLSVDAQVENVHFRFDRETPPTIGRRALVVNLSDLAAMGAAPVGALLSLAAPAELPLRVFDGLVDGFVRESDRYACPLVGGNLTRAEHCSLHVTVVGRVSRGGALLRGAGGRGTGGRGGPHGRGHGDLRVGDELYVTGMLGAAALARHRADHLGTRLTRVAVPRLAIGRKLAGSASTSACIDLSDGLATDLAQLLAASQLGAEVDFDALPVPRGFARACRELGLDPGNLAIAGGEDYELLFARRPGRGRASSAVGMGVRGVPVTRIGRVTAQAGIRGLPAVHLAGGHHF